MQKAMGHPLLLHTLGAAPMSTHWVTNLTLYPGWHEADYSLYLACLAAPSKVSLQNSNVPDYRPCWAQGNR